MAFSESASLDAAPKYPPQRLRMAHGSSHDDSNAIPFTSPNRPANQEHQSCRTLLGQVHLIHINWLRPLCLLKYLQKGYDAFLIAKNKWNQYKNNDWVDDIANAHKIVRVLEGGNGTAIEIAQLQFAGYTKFFLCLLPPLF